MRSKSVEKWIHENTSGRLREPLAYVAKCQVEIQGVKGHGIPLRD